MLLRIQSWLLILTFASILLVSKEYSLQMYGFRPEDFIAFFVLIALPFLFIKMSQSIHPGLLASIVFYFSYLFVISVVNDPSYIGNIFVLFAKELSYLGYFLLVYSLVMRHKIEDIPRLFLIIFILSLPALGYIFYQIIFGSAGIYGFAFYGHLKSPASSGLIALMLTYISYIYIQLFNNKLIMIYSIVCALTVLFIGSKLAAVGLLSFMAINALFETNKVKLLYLISTMFILFVGLYVAINSGISALHRLSGLFSPIEVIKNRGIWFKFQWIDGWTGFLFGGGLAKGHLSESNGLFSYGMAMDNQFLYFFVVLGLFGTMIFFAILFFLVKCHPKRSIQRRLQISLIASYFFMGMGVEVFQLSISGLTFWVVSGFLMAYTKKISYRSNSDISLNI